MTSFKGEHETERQRKQVNSECCNATSDDVNFIQKLFKILITYYLLGKSKKEKIIKIIVNKRR